jgi:hypothetical protein
MKGRLSICVAERFSFFSRISRILFGQQTKINEIIERVKYLESSHLQKIFAKS